MHESVALRVANCKFSFWASRPFCIMKLDDVAVDAVVLADEDADTLEVGVAVAEV